MNRVSGEIKEPIQSSFRRHLTRLRGYPEFGILIAFLTVFLVFSFTGREFLTIRSLTGIFTLVSELGVITIGVAFLMISGEFNLAVSAIYAASALLFATLGNIVYSPLALLITLGFAALCGLICGMITLRWRIPSFITTLGMMMFIKGIMLALTKGATIAYKGDSIAPKMLAKLIGHGFRPSHFWFVGLTLLFAFILRQTRYGNWVFATGGDKEVARAMGVNTNKVKLINFAISGLLAGLSGCIVLSRFESANPAYGSGLELEAIAAAVIGGSFLMGGYGTILGAFLGSCLLGMIRIGLVMSGAPGYWYQAFVGAILIIAVIINIKLRRLEM